MNGNIHFEILGKTPEIENEIFSFLEIEITRLVDIFNFFDSNSNLSKLNKSGKVEFCNELYFLLNKSIEIFKLTNGKFNIFLGNDIENRKNNNSNLISNFKFNDDFLKNVISKDENFIYFNNFNKLKIDLGGIAKGYIVDELIRLTKLKFKSNLLGLLIDARGDIGSFSRKNEFPIGVLNPFNENEDLEVLKLKSGNVISSGHTKQKYKFGSHILGDKTQVLTITLISTKFECYFLDALGTYFMQLELEEILDQIDFSDDFMDVECLITLDNGEYFKSSFFETFTY